MLLQRMADQHLSVSLSTWLLKWHCQVIQECAVKEVGNEQSAETMAVGCVHLTGLDGDEQS
jgi:hypothetical protein